MNLKGIISVSGMSGLYKILAQTKNGLIAESLVDGKRQPIYSNDKVSSLEDISIYGNNEDIPLKEVFKSIKEKLSGTNVPDGKTDPKEMRSVFASCVPHFAEDRVYTSDIKKVFSWYTLLNNSGILDLAEEEEASDNASGEEMPKEIPAAKKSPIKQKDTVKSSAPKASTKGMAKTQTVRKTGA
jgi:hypothetical protein